jgi:CelD/BcsL family acetyltransferase involved in cellulose biosynthesis
MLSKKRRCRLRHDMREYFDSGRAVLRWVEHARELPSAMELLVDLHQRRRRALGQPGCFASPRFAAFYHEVAPALFRAGQAQFYGLELDGKPAAAEFLLVGDGVLYVYQGGVDPEALDHKPGYLLCFAIVQRAIAQGYRALDFLRGDEPYKSHLRAEPRPSLTWRVVPDRTAAQMRHHLWLAGNNVKQWIKRGWLAKPAQPEACPAGNDCC